MSEGSGEIIIKGGSAEINFDPTLFEKDESDPKLHKHRNEGLKITQVIIEGGDEIIRNLESGINPDGFKGTIRVVLKK